MFVKLRKNIAQSIIEYSMLALVVGLAAAAIYNYAQRAVQGKMNQIGNVINAGLDE